MSNVINPHRHKTLGIPTNELLFYKCNETTGNVINYGSVSGMDLVPGCTGMMCSDPTQTTGGIEFNGDNFADGSSAAFNTAITNLQTYTICGWFKSNSHESYECALSIGNGSASAVEGLYPYQSYGNDGVSSWYEPDVDDYLHEGAGGPVNPSDGDYHFVMIRHKGLNDHELIASSTIVATDTVEDVELLSGMDNFVLGAYDLHFELFIGGAKYVRMYDYDVSDAEWAALAAEFPA